MPGLSTRVNTQPPEVLYTDLGSQGMSVLYNIYYIMFSFFQRASGVDVAINDSNFLLKDILKRLRKSKQVTTIKSLI